jgi:hypothetical protein
MDIQTAAVLMNWYNTTIDPKLATWSVGENVRSMDSFEYARQEVKKLGRILNFRVKVFKHVRVGTRYFGTYTHTYIYPARPHPCPRSGG